jgi:hypothetical protein
MYSQTKSFKFVLDPIFIMGLSWSDSIYLAIFLQEFAEHAPSINIKLFFPGDFDKLAQLVSRLIGLSEFVESFQEYNILEPIKYDDYFDEDFKSKIYRDDDTSSQARLLISLSEYFNADGVLTNNELLLDNKHIIQQKRRQKVLDLIDFIDILEVIAVGNDKFRSVRSDWKNLSLDVYYILEHWQGSKWAKWFFNNSDNMEDDHLRESYRNALLNRYPFIAYARDMVRFGEIQKNFAFRRGETHGYSMMPSYHLTNFYLMLWGMLEHVTSIVNSTMNLGLKEKQCGIRSKKFWSAINDKDSQFKELFNKYYKGWVDIMAAMRHAAAHHTIHLPSQMFEENDEIKKSDEEIILELKKDGIDFESTGNEKADQFLWSSRVHEWKLSKMKELAPSLVYFEMNDKLIFRDPISSIDYDMHYLNAIMYSFWALMLNR